MEIKLNYRLPQTADRKASFQVGIENELRRRLQLTGSSGIVSTNGEDVDNDQAACSLVVNSTNTTAIDVLAGTVVFPNGEFVDVYPTSLLSVRIDPAITESMVVRLEYGEIEDGSLEANPYYNFAAKPKLRKKTPLEMLVIETTATYDAQPADVLSKSVVLGVVKYSNSVLTIDNSRDTYSYSRPWSSPVDAEHRSFVGSGVQTPTNPHGMSANDLTVGSYTMWQALAGPPSCVLARPMSIGRIPGSLCSETIPAGSFFLDSTGRITGCAGAFYAYLGFWPERLTRACLSSSPTTEVAAWIPRGRNVVAVFDPLNVPTIASANIDVYYTKVTAGSLPGSLLGLQKFDVGQPEENELLVAGGSFITSLSDPSVSFADVGLIPMSFDVVVGNDGKVYKRPDCIYCNTRLDTLGAGPVPFTIQPKSPTRLRVAISNYVAALTEVRFQITGLNESGAAITEQVVFTGPLPAVVISQAEVIQQRVFTTNVFSAVTQFQVLVRNGDGPNTTVTVFAEYVPERPATADDLLLATVHWTGTDVSANYANGSNVVLDRRYVSRGGANRGLSPVGTFLMSGAMSEGVGSNAFSEPSWVTIVEDFNDPQWHYSPNPSLGSNFIEAELPSNSTGARLGSVVVYQSRLIPFARVVSTPSKVIFRLIPRSIHDWPNSAKDVKFKITLLNTSGTTVVFDTNMSSTGISMPYPPFQPALTSVGTLATVYGAIVQATSNTGLQPVPELLQGFMLQVRD